MVDAENVDGALALEEESYRNTNTFKKFADYSDYKITFRYFDVWHYNARDSQDSLDVIPEEVIKEVQCACEIIFNAKIQRKLD